MLPSDYAERVYAGVVGKIIGVYLGRPFEGWTNQRIEEQLGEIDYYVHDKVGVPLIVTDDDISGTFTFIRALEDYDYDPQLAPKQIGQTWLNYLIEGRSVLWWGGLGNSTEHTAYLRLREGIDAPQSGSIETNGKVVAEQIGAQIFIDGWAMVCPGDPERAADFARRAGSVSHDGESVYGAQVLAAMEAQAFVEDDIDKLLDIGVAQIPSDSVLAGMIRDIRAWHAENPDDWRVTFKKIQQNYGYDKYGGNCHIMPNHGLIIMALLHSNGDFSESMKIVNTAGWDTDCNSGNLGCLMGIRNGLSGIDSKVDWRTPFADICYLPTADASGGVSDAATQAQRIIEAGAALNGVKIDKPKNGARFHFSYPGSVQGFRGTNCNIANVGNADGSRSLSIRVNSSAGDNVRAMTNTFIESLDTAKYFERRGYGLMTSPSLNPGQVVRTNLSLNGDASTDADVALCIGVFNEEDEIEFVQGPTVTINPGSTQELTWQLPATDGLPISSAGIEIMSAPAEANIEMAYFDWHGTPNLELGRRKGTMWSRAWVNAVDTYHPYYPESFRMIQNHGTGMLLYGNRDWTNIAVEADVTPHLIKRTGISARTQGLRRYYALLLTAKNQVQLVKELDGTRILAETSFDVTLGKTYQLRLEANDHLLTGFVDGEKVLEATDASLASGGVGLVLDEGRTATQKVAISNV
ncbi:MAG: ADP-ribosylglycohydrolase family protein [Gammaproteobacteria bacterium]|nr:ADP-ribosylglycohydrolase family protein [Gammaproteobacteria bacterium]